MEISKISFKALVSLCNITEYEKSIKNSAIFVDKKSYIWYIKYCIISLFIKKRILGKVLILKQRRFIWGFSM